MPERLLREMSDPLPQLQLDWDDAGLQDHWPRGLDHEFYLGRLAELTPAVTLLGGARRVLEVAAASAVHACEMSHRGVSVFALDPSPSMLRAARQHMLASGAHVVLVRGIAETLPFRSGTFDRVLCHGAIDHVAVPDVAIAEMARVLAPDGRLVMSAVNYAGVSARLSRALYAVGRRLGIVSRDVHLFWDSPVPVEHTFECSYQILGRLGSAHLDLERCVGVSIGWGVPGWGGLLRLLPRRLALVPLLALDGCARRLPALADFVYTVWRPCRATR